MSQQRVKAIAQARGLTLRPADPKAATSRQTIPIRGQGKRGRTSAIVGSNGVLNAAGGRRVSTLNTGRASDPLASKVKVRTGGKNNTAVRPRCFLK